MTEGNPRPAAPREIGVVVLAAGASTRFGRPKQLAEFDGTSLLRRAAHSALAVGTRVVVVLGSAADELRETLEGLPVHVVLNGSWAEGMGSSIRTGVRAMLDGGPLGAVLVTLCDQPLVGPEALARLAAAYRVEGRSLVASSYAGTVGVPALFGAEYFDELTALDGATGAKTLFARHAKDVMLVECPEATLDVDVREDLERLDALAGARRGGSDE